jgi:hypothetical protein
VRPNLRPRLTGLLRRLAAACRDEQFWALRSRAARRELLRSGLSASGPARGTRRGRAARHARPAARAATRAFTLCTDSRTRLPIVLDEMAAGYAGALRDRVHREQEEGLRRQVAHVVAQDALTLLPNRADGEKRLRRAFSAARRSTSGCASWTSTAFAAVNDALGHDLGDRLLVEVATRLHQVAAPHLVIRNSGDEFAVLVEHVIDPAPSNSWHATSRRH